MTSGTISLKSISLITWIIWAGLSSSSWAQSSIKESTAITLKTAIEGLAANPQKRLNYEEWRQIPSLKSPMRSKGYLEFIPPDTLVKTVNTPSPSSFLLSSTEIRVTDPTTGESHSLKPDAIPELGYLRSSLVNLLLADEDAILAGWIASIGGTSTHWEMNLVPKDRDASGLQLVKIKGRKGVLQEIHIESLDGSVSNLSLQIP